MPAVVGSNCTLSVAVWPGFNVVGKVAPDMAKPLPVSVAALIVTGAVPVDDKVTDCAAAWFTTTLPNARLVTLTLSLGTAAFNCRAKFSDTLAALAFNVAACVVPSDDTIAVNPVLVAFAGTVTVAGTVTAALLLDRLTLRPLLGAAAFRVTVQASVPEPVMDAFLQESALNAAAVVPVVPVPFRVTAAAGLVEDLLAIVNCPVAAPAAAGLNCTFRL